MDELKKAEVVFQEGEYEKACELVQEVIVKHPKNADAYFLYAIILKKMNQLPAAIAALEQGIALAPTIAQAHNNLGSLYYQQGEIQKSITAFERALRNQPHYKEASYNLVLAYQKLGEFKRAINEALCLVEIFPDYFPAWYQLGKICFSDGQVERAVHAFWQALSLDPLHVESWLNLGAAFLLNKEYDEARRCYEKALELEETHIAHYNLGVIAEEKNNLDLAIQRYLLAEKNNSSDFSIQNNLGIAFIKKQRPDLALRHLEKALKLDPHNIQLSYTVAALKQDKPQDHAPLSYIEKLFDQYAERFDQHLLEGLEYRVPEALHQLLSITVRLEPRALTIVDLGCGTGLVGEYFYSYADKMIAVDVSRRMLEKAREKNRYDEYIAAGIEEYLSHHLAEFDLLIAADVLVYTGNLMPVFQVCVASLKSAGLFAFSVENLETGNFRWLPSGRFAHSEKYIKELAELCGFSILVTQKTVTRQQYEQPVFGTLYILKKL